MSFQKLLVPVLILILAGAAYYFISKKTGTEQKKELSTLVEKGEFKVYVTATGELKAKKSEKIRGPQGMRSARIYQTTISDMVPEGTLVNEGDYVATLDRTELDTRMKEAQTSLEKIQTQLDQAKIDTALELRSLRDQLINLKFGMEEKRLQVEQSKYEPQMVIRQSEIDLEKSERDYKQLIKRYELTQIKSGAKISEILTSMKQEQSKLQRVMDLSNDFMIRAPKSGMVIYARSWNGKVGPGSQISTWDPVVAELPDLSDMVTTTYVNEVDISKVRKGQDVKIKVDAFPENEYTGHIITVANIGEQLRGYDAKVFEVMVQVLETDSILRPAMTTSNEILTYIFEDVVHIPLEALQSDSMAYVFKKHGGEIVKQEVITGETNDNEVIIEYGLEGKDEIYLTIPSDPNDLELIYLPKDLKKSIKDKQEEEKKMRQAQALEKAKKVKDEQIPQQSGRGGSFIIIE